MALRNALEFPIYSKKSGSLVETITTTSLTRCWTIIYKTYAPKTAGIYPLRVGDPKKVKVEKLPRYY